MKCQRKHNLKFLERKLLFLSCEYQDMSLTFTICIYLRFVLLLAIEIELLCPPPVLPPVEVGQDAAEAVAAQVDGLADPIAGPTIISEKISIQFC